MDLIQLFELDEHDQGIEALDSDKASYTLRTLMYFVSDIASTPDCPAAQNASSLLTQMGLNRKNGLDRVA